jgi:hypothetical protein
MVNEFPDTMTRVSALQENILVTWFYDQTETTGFWSVPQKILRFKHCCAREPTIQLALTISFTLRKHPNSSTTTQSLISSFFNTMEKLCRSENITAAVQLGIRKLGQSAVELVTAWFNEN